MGSRGFRVEIAQESAHAWLREDNIVVEGIVVPGWMIVKGNNPNALPKPPKFTTPPGFKAPKNGIVVKGGTLKHAITLNGLLPVKVRQGISAQIVAVILDGDVEPACLVL